uniref:Reverse transcriptase domain-containing protein n=1 Tax=Amphimedon queenslandica TaxID=400682 RepID=A0A1X7SDE3_AMPQE
MLDNNIISRSHSPWSSPIILVKKKDGSLRFCVDYRKVNEVTRKDAYPLPRIDDTLDTLAGSQWFTTLDLLSGYWQVEVEEEDREKTAFCTKEGLFHFNVMPFGLCNAPATFQRLMDMLLAGLLWEACLVYIDDVIIMGKDFPSHLSNIAAVFTRLRNAGLKTPLKLIK